MNEHDLLAQRFEADRVHLRTVAFRILGSLSDAEDAVQEAWFRLSRSNIAEVNNLTGWLTTVVARVSLNMLQSRKARREDPSDENLVENVGAAPRAEHPEDEALLADSVGSALMLILDTLEPSQRLAFVLHDMFGVPFDEIAPIVGRSPTAARQLASRARRRVQGAETVSGTDRGRQQEIVAAFLVASREGRFEALLALLDPDVVLRADATTVAMGAPREVLGADAVATSFAGRAKAARLTLVDGRPGAMWSVDGRPRVVFDFTVVGGMVVEIRMVSDAGALTLLELELIDKSPAE